MNVENIEVKMGEFLFIPKMLPSGNKKYVPGEVVDLNEHVKAVKLSYSETKTKVVRKWHPASTLLRTAPIETKETK